LFEIISLKNQFIKKSIDSKALNYSDVTKKLVDHKTPTNLPFLDIDPFEIVGTIGRAHKECPSFAVNAPTPRTAWSVRLSVEHYRDSLLIHV